MANEKTEIEKLNLNSMDIAEEKQSELLRLFPEIRTENGKIDFDRLKLALGELVDTGKERYGMNWPGKAECFKTIQTSSMGTLLPLKEQSIKFEESENLIIEGDNLETLKLLQKSYLGRIKVIYIDPPYNTGSDFIYPDNFSESLQTYLEYTGQVDGEGKRFGTNLETDGRFHSNWLNMMFPRLYLARNLLSNDGAVFVNIDDSEASNLKKIMDEIFGEENFIGQISWKHTQQSKNDEPFLSRHHNYLMIYRKSESLEGFSFPRTDEDNVNYSNPDNDPKGPWRSGDVRSPSLRQTLKFVIETPSGKKIQPPENGWRWSKESVAEKISTGEIIFNSDETKITRKIYLSNQEGRTPETIWDGERFGTTRVANAELKDLFGDDVPFDTPKPTSLIRSILDLFHKDKDFYILDFFAGSGTSADSVIKQNLKDNGKRKFILVQLPEKTEGKFETIAEITKERIRRTISKSNSPEGFRVFKLADSNFKTWNTNTESKEILESQLAFHVDHVKHERTADDILYEILLKSGFPLTTKVETQKFGKQTVYSIAGGMLLVCLEDSLTLELIKHIAEQKPERVVCLDQGFANNDQLKANAVQIFRTKGIASFKTV